MKKTLTLAFAFLLCTLFCLGAAAFEMESVESAAEAIAKDLEPSTALSGELDITDSTVLNNSSYGTLIYYNDFDGYELDRPGNITGGQTYIDSFFNENPVSLNGGNASLKIVADPKDETNKALKITAAGNYARAVFQPQTKVTKLGFYTFVMDFYVPSDNAGANIHSLVYLNGDGHNHTVKSFGESVLDGWATDRSCGSFCVVEDGKQVSSTSGRGNSFDRNFLCDRRGTIDAGKYFYIDNLRLYYAPGKTVAFNYNLPEGVSDIYNIRTYNKGFVKYTMVAEEFVKIGAAVPEIYAPGYTFLGWKDADGNYVDYYTKDTTTLTAQWTPLKPGLNALTGTFEKATFEKGDRQYLIFEENGFGRQVTANDIQSTVSGNDSSRVLKASAKAVRYVVFDFPVQMENGRKYHIAWDSYTDVNYSGMLGWFLNYYGSGKHITLDMGKQHQANAAGKWHTQVQNTGGAATASAVYMQYKFAEEHAVSGALNIYFDNLAVYPFYKITYHFSNGSTVVDQVLDPGKADQTYSPSSSEYDVWTGEGNKICIGWATTQNANEPEKTIALANKDVDLYPVWMDVPESQFLASYYCQAAPSSDYYHIPVAKAFKSVSADVGRTEAVVTTYHNSTVKIQPKGYAGDIKLTFTLEDDSVVTETVHLIGGTKWRPGLNTLTGTTSPLAMDDMTEAEVEYALWLNGNRWKLDDNPKTDGINPSAKAVYATAQYAVITNRHSWNPTIEKDRPLSYEYDILSWSDVYTMINGSGGETTGNIYADYFGKNAKDAWRHEKAYIDMINKTPISNAGLPEPNAKDGILYMGHSGKTGEYGKLDKDGTLQAGKNAYFYLDNIAYIPYYKITYELTDGTKAYDYALYDDEGTTLLTAYTPKASLLGSKRYKLSPDGEVFSADTPIPLDNADITLYAVTDGYATTTENEFSFRDPSAGSAGIRFKATVSAATRFDADEYGFLVARTDKLGENTLAFNSDATKTTYTGMNNKNFSGTTNEGVKYSGAVNYRPGTENKVDIIYDTDPDTGAYRFGCVLVNLDKGYTENGITYENRYDVAFTIRPYVIVAGKYYYGESVSKSYNQIAANA